MPLDIAVVAAGPAPHTAAPAITFRLRIAAGEGPTHAMALRCQVQIDAARRRYAADERERLFELFGGESQFDRALRPLTWAQCALVVPGFDGEVECDLSVACTYDLEVASAKYLHAVRDGEVPLRFLFTGTIFRVSAGGAMTVEPVSWDVEAAYRLPAQVWRTAMDQFFPGGGWLRLRTDTIDRLQAFRGRSAVVSWDEALDLLLERAMVEHPS